MLQSGTRQATPNAEVQKDITAEKSATTTENSSKSTTQHRAKAAQTVLAGTGKVNLER